MSDIATTALTRFRQALEALRQGCAEARSDLERDGAIQRFEFTFELAWKALCAAMEHEGFRCAGPRSCIKEAARHGFLTDAEIWLDMLEDRNQTTHTLVQLPS